MTNLTKTFTGNANSYFGEVKRAQEKKAVRLPATVYDTLDKLSSSHGKVIHRPQGGYRRSAYITEKAVKQEIDDEVLSKPMYEQLADYLADSQSPGRLKAISGIVSCDVETLNKHIIGYQNYLSFCDLKKPYLVDSLDRMVEKAKEHHDGKFVVLVGCYNEESQSYAIGLMPDHRASAKPQKYLCLSEKGEAYISDKPVGEAEDSIDNILRCARIEIANSFISPWAPCFINIDDVDAVQKELDKLYRKPITCTEYKYLNFHEDASLSVSDEPKFRVNPAHTQPTLMKWVAIAIENDDYKNWSEFSTLITDGEEIQQMIEGGEIETP